MPTPPEKTPSEDRTRLSVEGERRVIAALSGKEPLERTLSNLCQLIEEEEPRVVCAVMRQDHKRQRLAPLAGPKLSRELLTALENVPVADDAPSCGRAAHRRQPVLTAAMETDRGWSRLAPIAREQGLCACWSIPLLRDRERSLRSKDVLGTLDFYFEEPQEEEQSLLKTHRRAAELMAMVLRSGTEEEATSEEETVDKDTLTGLPNRTSFWNRLRQLIHERRDDPARFAVAVVDVDQLKTINDTLGFRMGDVVLQVLGQRLRDVVRVTDTVARIGGDEFALLIQDLEQDDDIGSVGQRIREKVTAPYDFDGHDLFLTGSIGLAVFPWDGMDEHSLLRNAETALIAAKERGGSDFQLFRPTMVSDKPTFEAWWERSKLGSELRHVLERDQMELHYQLKFDAATQKVSGAEALIRWNHPSLGQLPPGRFIGMAEQTGFIIQLGEWVMETACIQNKKWQDSGLGSFPISVNVSPHQFRHGRLVERITQILDKTGLEAKYLELEITETLAMEDKGNNLARLEALHSLGLPISIDDFGTGFSSLAYLNKFPIDTLKIDRSFVRNLGSDLESDAIVRAVISLAKALSLKTVAEGVETEEQFEFLLEHGCDTIQGYYFGRPEAVGAITKTLIQRS